MDGDTGLDTSFAVVLGGGAKNRVGYCTWMEEGYAGLWHSTGEVLGVRMGAGRIGDGWG